MTERKYKVRFLPFFEMDLIEIVDYISYNLENPYAANLLVEEIEKAIRKRQACPESFEPYHSAKDRRHPYYRIYVKNFIIYYVIIDGEDKENKVIEVRRILYSKRGRRELI